MGDVAKGIRSFKHGLKDDAAVPPEGEIDSSQREA